MAPTRQILLFLGLAVVAIGLAMFQLDKVPLRGDEAYNIVNWTREPFSEQWWHMLRSEPHPIGGFFLYIAWIRGVGNSVFAVRMLSVLGHFLGLAVILTLTRRLTRGTETANATVVLAGLFWAIHPLLLWHAQDARHYSLYVSLSMFSWLLLLHALETQTRRSWVLATLAQAITAYLYYFEALVLVARAGYALWSARHSRADLTRVIVSYLALGVLLILYMVMLYEQLAGSGGGYQGNAVYANFHRLMAWMIPSLALGIGSAESALTGVIVIVLFAIGSQSIRQRGLLPVWAVVPLGMVYLVSLRAEYFTPRYVIAIVPALVIAAACAVPAIARWLRPTQWRSAAVAGALALSGIFIIHIYAYFFVQMPKSPDWRAFSSYLMARTDANAVILSDSLDPAIEYYYRGEAGIVFLTRPDDPMLDEALANYDAYWLLQGERTGWAENILRERTQYIYGERYAGLVQYRAWEVDDAEIAVPMAIRFGDTAIFRGYTQLGNSTVLLYWEALAPTDVEHSIYTRLSGADGEIALDHGLANSIVSLSMWVPGGIYRDPVALPDNVTFPSELRVGIYPTGSSDLMDSACGTADAGCPVGTLRE